jgi:alpha-1,3-rhamnosyl/mannosyltransferase
VTTRIGVNLLWLVPGDVGGSEESTIRALDAVADPAIEAGVELVLLALPELEKAHPATTARFRTVIAPVTGSNRPRRVLCENTWLHSASRDHRLELLHHAGGVVPPAAPRPCTLTIHDLQPLDLPANFSSTKRNYIRSVLALSTRRACRVAVPSAATAARVEARLGVDPSRIEVVPWSVSVPDVAPDRDDLETAVRALGVGDRFFLFPAVTHPHKNHLMLLDAFDELARTDDTIELVFTGGIGRSETEVRSRILRSPATVRIHRLGRVSEHALDALYRRAVGVVYPSSYEGFGLPPLEAMVRGIPVAASDIPVMSEVAEHAALLVDPTDVGAWAAAMQTLASDATRHAALASAGRRQAARFGPDRTAEALLGFWLGALERQPRVPATVEPPESAA